jgi:hypothetical protein
MLGRIFEPMREVMVGGRKKFMRRSINCMLHQMLYQGEQSKVDEWVMRAARMGEMRNTHSLVGKAERKRQLVTARLRLEDNSRVDLRGVVGKM